MEASKVRAATSTAFWRTNFSNFELQVMVLGSLVVLYVALGSLVFPEGPDQAIFAWIGSVILDGGVPYRDGVDIKGPLTYYFYALAQGLFGRNELSIRVFDLAIIVGGCWLLRRLVLRLTHRNPFGANCAVIFFCLMYYGGGYADTAQAEGWGGFLILATVVILLERSVSANLRMTGAGVLIGLAVLIKPTFLIYILLPCTLMGAGAMLSIPSLLLCAASLVATLAVAVLGLLHTQAFGDFLDVLAYLYTTYASIDRPSLTSGLSLLPKSVIRFGLLLPYLIAPISLKSLRKSEGGHVVCLIATWTILATATVVIQRRYWHDHWLPAAMALAVILGAGCNALRQRYLVNPIYFSSWGRVLVVVVIVGALGIPAVRAVYVNELWLGYALGFKSQDDYIAQITVPFNQIPVPFNYTELRRVSNYIDQSTAPDQRLVIWGWDVSLFVLSQRKSSTRFGVFQEVTDEGAVRDRFRAKFMQDVESRPPDEIIINTRGIFFLPPGAGWKLLNGFPEFKRFVYLGYSRKATIGAYEVWAKRAR